MEASTPPLSCSQTTPIYALPQCGRPFNFHKQRSGWGHLALWQAWRDQSTAFSDGPTTQLYLSQTRPLTATRLRARNGMIKRHPLVRDFQSSSFLALWPSLKVTNLVQDLWLDRAVTWYEVWTTRRSLQTPLNNIKSQSPGSETSMCVCW